MFHRLIYLIGLMLALTAPSVASTFLFTWVDQGTGNLGTSKTFTEGTMKVTAYVFNSDDGQTTNPTNALYAKNLGGDEVGLGTTADTSGQHEIVSSDYIQLDFSDLKSKFTITGATLQINSSTGTEGYRIYGKNTIGGALTTPPFVSLYSGSSESSFSVLSYIQSYNTLAVTETATCGNVLLGLLTIDATQNAPEPATMWMLGGAAGLLALARRLRRTV
jgi:hypothetical protein